MSPGRTHDIDLELAIQAPADANAVVASLKTAFPEPVFYLDVTAARDAIRSRGMFNVIDTAEGDKIDAFDRARFERRYVEVFEGVAGVTAPAARDSGPPSR